jgi:outer membrane protein assembly complex protein YaeT
VRIRFALLAFLSLAAASPARAVTVLEADRVEVTGVTVFQPLEIQPSVEIGPGDRLERVKIQRTSENLQNLYRLHGYEEMAVKSRLVRKKTDDGTFEDVLEFNVVEGRATRVQGVRFVPDSVRDDIFRDFWDKLILELEPRLGIKSGDLLDQEKLSAGRRAIQDLLASEEFIGAKVAEIRAIPGTASNAGKWVDLEVHVNLGDRVTFGFRGNTAFTNLQLLSLIDELRIVGFGKDFVGAIRARLVDEYRSEGFAQVKVTAFTVEKQGDRRERHVTYVIEEGPKVRVRSVDFDGNLVFTNEELKKQFYALSTPLLQQNYYAQKDVQRSAELVVEWIKAQGYLFAKLVIVNNEFSAKRVGIPDGAEVRLVVYLYEGEQTRVGSVSIIGARAVPQADIRSILQVEEGKPLNLFAFSEGIDVLKAVYRAKGYLDIKLQNEGGDQIVHYSDENRTADIALEVVEGQQYRVSQLLIEGLQQTEEAVVRRELQLKVEDVLEEPKVIESETRLRRLGIFSLVTFHAIDDAERPGYKILKISIQEGTPGVVAGGLGFRNDLGGRVFGQAEYTNLWGKNHTVGLNLTLNRRLEDYRFVEFQSQITYLYPWFLLDELLFRPTLTYSRTQYAAFDADNLAAAATWERRLWSHPNITGSFTASMEQIRQFNAPAKFADIDNQNLLIGSITPAIRFDTRDQPLNPSRGFFAQASFEFALPQLSETEVSDGSKYTVAYTKFQLRADYFLPIFRSGVWYSSFRTGFERNLVEPLIDPATGLPDPKVGTIPLVKQFALGGAGSLRGFKEQELNYQSTVIHGTLSFVNYRTQIDVPFAGALRFGPFLDAANLVLDSYSFGNLRYGAGVGFHYPTPVGPVNLDWGFKIDPRPGEDPYRFYFSIGVI